MIEPINSDPMDFHTFVNEEDLKLEQSLRPKFLRDFVGQEQIKNNLGVYIQSAKMRNTCLDHILLSGPPGLGKTTLSQIVANEMQNKSTNTSGPLLEKMGDLVAILTNLEQDQILFVDEIHRMNRQIEEVLYSAMEDFKIDILIGKGTAARSVKIDLPRFTLIGATTRPGMLSSPLRDRFGIPFRVEFYQPEDLLAILLRSASHVFQVPITKEAAREIANRLLSRAFDFSMVQQEKAITLPTLQKTFLELGIDSIGLNSLDRHYLRLLANNFQGGPVGLTTLSAALSEDKDSLEEVVEPYLLQLGLIQKTARGREITQKARDYLATEGDPKSIKSPSK